MTPPLPRLRGSAPDCRLPGDTAASNARHLAKTLGWIERQAHACGADSSDRPLDYREWPPDAARRRRGRMGYDRAARPMIRLASAADRATVESSFATPMWSSRPWISRQARFDDYAALIGDGAVSVDESRRGSCRHRAAAAGDHLLLDASPRRIAKARVRPAADRIRRGRGAPAGSWKWPLPSDHDREHRALRLGVEPGAT